MRWPTLLLALSALALASVPSPAALSVQFDSRTGAFAVSDPEYGKLLVGAQIEISPASEHAIHVLAGSTVRQQRRTTAEGEELRVTGGDGPGAGWARFDMPTGRRAVEIRAGLQQGQGKVSLWSADPQMGAEPIVGLLKDQASRDRHILTTTLGPANFREARALYDPERDLAMVIGADGDAACFAHDVADVPERSYHIESEVPSGGLLLRLSLRPHYYRDELGIKYFAPLTKRSFWKTAPCVAMTWYGTHTQTKENLFPLIDWVAKHLRPYAGHLVFQLDDNYAIHDDAGMRKIADYIRSKGLIPGLWFTPFAVVPPENCQTHRDWFLHAPNGEALKGFGGISYGFLDNGTNYVLDARNPEVSREWFEAWWRKLSDTWGYDFFKIDGQPWVADVYRQAAGEAGVAAYRAGLARAREIVGPDKFINGCWGIPLEAIGRVNGSRTGGDTGNQPHAMDVILHWNFLNNVAWWCDPDAAANLAHASIERVRLNTQARALTGQQFLTDDIWTDVPDSVAHVWQRAMPTADIRPANLYPIENWADYTVFDLKIDQFWYTRDVVGVFNYGTLPRTESLDLGALALEPGQYHLYDFWADRYLGLRPSDAKLSIPLKPYEGRLFGLSPAKALDAGVIATTRHILQGSLDELPELGSSGDRNGDTIRGSSEHLVAGEPYTLLIADGNQRIAVAGTDNGRPSWSSEPGVSRLTIAPARSGEAHWWATLRRPEGPALEAEAIVEAEGGRVGLLRLANPGTKPVSCRLESSAAWLTLERRAGIVGPGAATEIALTQGGAALPYDTHAKAEVVVTTEPAVPGTPLRLPIEFYTGLPPNLALQATASASSVWGPEYEARMANDGSPMTRWNSKQGEDNNAWLALTWPQPVRFDRVVIDETREWGLRIQQWVLEARDGGEWREIAHGTTVGPGRRIEVPLTTARELRLRIPKATVTPTINEMEVYRFARE